MRGWPSGHEPALRMLIVCMNSQRLFVKLLILKGLLGHESSARDWAPRQFFDARQLFGGAVTGARSTGYGRLWLSRN